MKNKQQKLFIEFSKALQTENLDYSVENEFVFVKDTEAGHTLLVIDEQGDGMFSFASKETNDKHQRIFFEYASCNVSDLVSKFKNT